MREQRKKLRVIFDGKYNGATNMAIDEILFNSAILLNETILRFYGWEKETISFGRTLDINEIKKELQSGVDFVRRPTGGGIVKHFNDYTFSFCCNFYQGNLMESYNKIHLIIKKVFEKFNIKDININNNLKNLKKKVKNKYCFNIPVKYDLMYKNKKIIGGAQTVYKNYLLYQGTMFLEYFKLNINEFLNVIADYFAINYSLDISLSNIFPREMEIAGILSKNKYKNKDWLYYGINNT